jgi:hypothetical protein
MATQYRADGNQCWMGRGHQAGGEFRVEKTTSDTDFVQITATTDYATGQALLYALTGPDTFGRLISASSAGRSCRQHERSGGRRPVSQTILSGPCGHGGR